MTVVINKVHYILEYRITYPGNNVFVPRIGKMHVALFFEVGQENWNVIASYTEEELKKEQEIIFKT